MSEEEEEEEEEVAGSFVRLNCFGLECDVKQVIPFGKHGGEVELRTREEAMQLAFSRMRKHVRIAFMAEHTPGSQKNAMSPEDQQFWKEQLAGQNNFGSKTLFHEWELKYMVPKCRHHPLHHRSQAPWMYLVHICSSDKSESTSGGEEGDREVEEVEVNYYPRLTSHWPLTHRQELLEETAEASSKKRKSLQWSLANAAVRGYKRFCKIEGKVPESKELRPGWVQQARRITKAYIDVARLECKGRQTDHKQAPVSDATEHSLRCILNSANMHTDIGIGLQDIQYPPRAADWP